MMVDKPGCGDSEGGPWPEIDFYTELDGYRQGLKALKGVFLRRSGSRVPLRPQHGGRDGTPLGQRATGPGHRGLRHGLPHLV